MNTKLLTSILQSSNKLITSEDFLKRNRMVMLLLVLESFLFVT